MLFGVHSLCIVWSLSGLCQGSQTGVPEAPFSHLLNGMGFAAARLIGFEGFVVCELRRRLVRSCSRSLPVCGPFSTWPRAPKVRPVQATAGCLMHRTGKLDCTMSSRHGHSRPRTWCGRGKNLPDPPGGMVCKKVLTYCHLRKFPFCTSQP